MREILTLQLGQCGNQIGAKFWEVISCEHGINCDGVFCGVSPHQLERIEVYYTDGYKNGRYVPRSILADMEPGVLDSIRSRQCGRLFKPDNYVSAAHGAGNNWARGHLSEGKEMSENIMDLIRKESEDAECMQGFQVIHSLGGGTGAGLGTLLLRMIREEFPTHIISTHSVIPSPEVSDIVVEPYNCVLSIHDMIDNTDETFCLDNQALMQICARCMKNPKPTYAEMNHIVSMTLSGVTSSFRFPGQLNTNLRKLAVNMVPFPRLHFLIPGYAPLIAQQDMDYHNWTVNDIVMQLFESNNMMAACDPAQGKYLTTAVIFRGRVSTRLAEHHTSQIQGRNKAYFTEWIPNNIKIAMCDIAPPGFDKSGVFIGNSTSIRDVFKRVNDQFEAMYSRKAFFHWYEAEGMAQDGFTEAHEDLTKLLEEYSQYQYATSDPGNLEYSNELNRRRKERDQRNDDSLSYDELSSSTARPRS